MRAPQAAAANQLLCHVHTKKCAYATASHIRVERNCTFVTVTIESQWLHVTEAAGGLPNLGKGNFYLHSKEVRQHQAGATTRMATPYPRS